MINETGKVLSITKDPLKLSGFFPMAEPVQPITGTGKRTPVCPYRVYKTLAEELDRITVRINAIIKGLKVRGAVASDAAAIEELATAEDNTLVPIANMEGIAAAGGWKRRLSGGRSIRQSLSCSSFMLPASRLSRRFTKSPAFPTSSVARVMPAKRRQHKTSRRSGEACGSRKCSEPLSGRCAICS